jgi:uncharacterized protein
MKSNIVSLPGGNNYAIILPGTIMYGLEVNSNEELSELIKEAEEYQPESQKNQNIHPFSTIGLIPTFDCNLRCIYCYARGGDSKEVLLFTIATDAIKYIFEKEKNDSLKIDLVGGGEPLLYIDLVRDIVDYAKSLFKNVEVHVVTNTTFGKKTLDWITKNNVLVRVSYDGVMQEKQRPFWNGRSSKQIVTSNINKLVDSKIPLMVQCIVTSDGVNTLRKTMTELINMGVKTVKFEAARSTDVSRKANWVEPNPVIFAKALLDVIEFASEQDKDIKIDTGYFSIPNEGNYCGIFRHNRMITPTGLITSCLEVSRPTDPYSDKIIYGEVSQGKIVFDPDKHQGLSKIDISKQIGGCISCNLQMICRGGCPMEGIWESGFPLRKSRYTCAVEHAFLPKLLLDMAKDPKIVSVVANEAQILC